MDKIVVYLDLDGTLLTDEKSITSRNVDLIRKAHQEYGVQFAIATARTTSIAEGVAAEIGEACKYVMSSNGATVKHLETGEYIHDKSIPMDKREKLIEFCTENNLGYMAMTPEARYFPIGYEYVKDLDQHMSAKFPDSTRFVENVEEYALNPDNKILSFAVIGGEEKLLAHSEELKEIAGISVARLCHYSTSGEYPNSSYLDVMGENVDKGTAMESIKQHSGASKTAAFGDGNNDIEMISVADYGFVMRNADPELMREAKIYACTVDNNNESGVGETLYDFLEYLEKKGKIEKNPDYIGKASDINYDER